MSDALTQILSLVPTIGAASFFVHAIVEVLRSKDIIKDGDATYWQMVINGAIYLLFFASAQFGVNSKLDEVLIWINSHTDLTVALISMVVVVATSSGATKLWHEAYKKVLSWFSPAQG